MMRKAYKPILVEEERENHTSVDQTVEEFASTMEYGKVLYASQEDFLKAHGSDWEMELHSALKDVLDPQRSVLGIGSGEGEHELRFFVDGYQIAASDVVAEAFSPTLRLFPGFRAFRFDIFNPSGVEDVRDMLITGLDFYFDQDKAQMIFDHSRSLLEPGGRLIFVLRYRDNLLTWLIDCIGIPLYCSIMNLIRVLRGRSGRYQLKFHGYRRSGGEIVRMAEKAGFRPAKIRYAGYGVELMRLDLHLVFPALYQWFRRLDRRLCLLNNATVFEFLT